MRRCAVIVVVLLAGGGSAHGHRIEPTGGLLGTEPSAALGWGLIAPASAAMQIRVEARDGYRYITADGLPDHAAGAFPNRNNPNRISAQSYQFRVPLHPAMFGRTTPLERRGLFGIAVNGVAYDPFTAEFWNNDP
ncbi:MAG: hypothetical protein FJX52_01605, partial [Alphaproteobacteria bacterium]|nr:hypothetical protein [Alphaproteobacteria bacterium]